ncbi:hypothetical protein AO239_02445 [Pseudomonas sp. ICMP 19500]|nr:hypothetical protein AO239_02445 [Pseudomonas sp. ICMP 19500]OEC70463.1 hypothetical protein A7D21_23565 [Pseudomonas sp. AP19]
MMQEFSDAGEWMSEQQRSRSGREADRLMTIRIVSTQWSTKCLNGTNLKPQVCRKTLVAD